MILYYSTVDLLHFGSSGRFPEPYRPLFPAPAPPLKTPVSSYLATLDLYPRILHILAQYRDIFPEQLLNLLPNGRSTTTPALIQQPDQVLAPPLDPLAAAATEVQLCRPRTLAQAEEQALMVDDVRF